MDGPNKTNVSTTNTNQIHKKIPDPKSEIFVEINKNINKEQNVNFNKLTKPFKQLIAFIMNCIKSQAKKTKQKEICLNLISQSLESQDKTGQLFKEINKNLKTITYQKVMQQVIKEKITDLAAFLDQHKYESALDADSPIVTDLLKNLDNAAPVLLNAYHHNNMALAKKVFAEGNINKEDQVTGNVAIQQLSSSVPVPGHCPMVDLLLKHIRVDVNLQLDSDRIIATWIAGIGANIAGLEGDFDAKDSIGYTPLMHACANGHKDTVKQLILKNVNLDEKNNIAFTALMLACLMEHKDIAKLLLAAKANPDLQNGKGYTALMFACDKGLKDIVKPFLDNGTNLEIVNKDKGTALTIASQKGYDNIAEQLCTAGAKSTLITMNLSKTITRKTPRSRS